MSQILIQPHDIRSVARQLNDKANLIYHALKEVDQQVGELHDVTFDGKLADSVRLRYARQRDYLLNLSNIVRQFSDNLDRAADTLQKADQANNPMAGLFIQLSKWGINIGIPLLPNIKWPPKIKPDVEPSPDNDFRDNPEISQQVEKTTPIRRKVAENVPAGIGDDGLYWRRGFDSAGNPISNCTWYAAAAVKYASGGKIDLNNTQLDWRHYPPQKGGYGWGDARNWSSWAEKYAEANPDGPVLKPDQSPKAGDVYNKGNHVAFVEEVNVSEDGKTMSVVISEENASGKAYKGATMIDVANDDQGSVKRWRRVLTYDIEPNSNPPKIVSNDTYFIHFRYPES